jgi:hypothetical protein
MGLAEAVFIGTAGTFIVLLSGAIIQHIGFTANYLILGLVVAAPLIPIRLVTETVRRRPVLSTPIPPAAS